MRIPIWLIAVPALLLLAATAVLAVRAIARRRGSDSRPEQMLLEEAVVSEPVAPGMSGKAVLGPAKGGRELKIRAVDGAQAFSRGTRVRIIDYADGAYLVEQADEEHLVR